MYSKMKKMVAFLEAVVIMAALFLLLGMFKPGLAAAAPSEPPGFTGTNVGVNSLYLFKDPSFTGVSTYRIEQGTPTATAVLLKTGSGLLYGVSASSGADGGYCLAFDSATVSGITRDTANKAITPQVKTVSSSTNCTSNGTCGEWSPRWPKHYTNGLVGIKDGTLNCLYEVTDDAGTNPVP